MKGDRDVRTIGAEIPETTEGVVILGVDTHLDFHVAVAIDHVGRRLGDSSVPTTAKGYQMLLRWAEGFGPVRCAGIEGTSSYGAGLTRHLRARGIEVLEVERAKHRRRSPRRNLEKSDPSDAERAARRAVLAGEASSVPKSGDGTVEMIRALRAARRSAIKARTQAANQLQSLRVTAPEELRHRLRELHTKELVSVAARFRLGDAPATCPRPPGSRSDRWPAVTRPSPRRSPSWRRTSIGWWRKPPRSCYLCRASAPTTPRRS
jgi:transposase